MKNRYVIYFFLAFSIFSFACKRSNNETKQIDFTFKRFELDFLNLDIKNIDSSLLNLSKEYPLFFMQEDALELYKQSYLYNLDFVNSHDSVVNKFGDLNLLKNDLYSLLSNYANYFPVDKYQVFTYASNYDIANKIVVTDSAGFIALDCYLGSNYFAYAFYPKYFSETLSKEYILSDFAIELAKKNIRKNTSDLSFLQEMIYYGKVYCLASFLLPDHSDYLLMNYLPNQIEWCKENETSIWKYYIDNDILFNTSAELKSRFINPAPFSKFYLSIDNDSPGRTACWMGWQIVKSYLNNTTTTLEELIVNTNAQEILTKSNYKPQ